MGPHLRGGPARTARIICIGNRYIADDSLGLKVFDRLSGLALPENVELVGGGLSGLDLLYLLEGADRVVFVDAIDGLPESQDVLVLRREEIFVEPSTRFDHGTSFLYLLGVAPQALEGPMPEVFVVGGPGATGPEGLDRISEKVLELVGG